MVLLRGGSALEDQPTGKVTRRATFGVAESGKFRVNVIHRDNEEPSRGENTPLRMMIFARIHSV